MNFASQSWSCCFASALRQCACLLLLPLISFAANAGESNHWTELYRSSRPSVAYILANGGVCSGSLIDRQRVLTAWHCVDRLSAVRVGFFDKDKAVQKQTFAAQVVYKDAPNDIAILRLLQPMDRPVKTINSKISLQEGQEICTIGHPFAVDLMEGLDDTLAFVLSAGLLSKLNDDVTLSDMSISPGNSGGGVFNRNGELVAMVSAKYIGPAAGQLSRLSTLDSIHTADKNSRTLIEALPWSEAKSRWYLHLLSGSLSQSSIGRDGSQGMQEWELDYRFADRLSIAGSWGWGSSNNLSTNSLRIGWVFAGPDITPLMSTQLLIYVGSRSFASEVTKSDAKMLGGAAVSILNSALSLRYERSLYKDHVHQSFLVGTNVFALFGG